MNTLLPRESIFSVDTVYCGRLLLAQSKNGYRSSVDALLLTWFAGAGFEAECALDIGAGCGVVGMGLKAAGFAKRVILVERQDFLARAAMEGICLNGLTESLGVVRCDVCAMPFALGNGGFDLVVSNPPFWPAGKGHQPPNHERLIACHETDCNISNWVKAAATLLARPKGRLVVVFPARRLEALVTSFLAVGLSGTRLRLVHPTANRPAELVLFEGRPGTVDRLVVEPPLFLRTAGGEDTPEAAAIIQGGFSPRLAALSDRRDFLRNRVL